MFKVDTPRRDIPRGGLLVLLLRREQANVYTVEGSSEDNSHHTPKRFPIRVSGRQWLIGYDLIFRLGSFANIHGVREGSPITRRRLHTSVRKTLLSYYSEEEATEIVKAAKKLRMSISNFIASAALKEAEVTNSQRRKSH